MKTKKLIDLIMFSIKAKAESNQRIIFYALIISKAPRVVNIDVS